MVKGVDREALLTPTVKPAGERSDPRDATPPEKQRHTGARGFIGSGAVQDDISVARDLMVALLQLLHGQAQGSGNEMRLSLEVQ